METGPLEDAVQHAKVATVGNDEQTHAGVEADRASNRLGQVPLQAANVGIVVHRASADVGRPGGRLTGGRRMVPPRRTGRGCDARQNACVGSPKTGRSWAGRTSSDRSGGRRSVRGPRDDPGRTHGRRTAAHSRCGALRDPRRNDPRIQPEARSSSPFFSLLSSLTFAHPSLATPRAPRDLEKRSE